MLSSRPGAAALQPTQADFDRELRAVLADPARLRLAFQPIVDLGHGMLAGYETLARIDAEPKAAPDRWFAAAERAGLRADLEALVIARALAMRAQLPPNCFLTVNVGPHVLGEPAVQEAFADGGDLAGLVVEITEQAAVEDYESLARAIEPLRAAGAVLAVDDAGAGHSSLRHITMLRPSFVKVDRGLVERLDGDPAKAASVEMLGMLAGRLDAWLIAEGVERDSELLRLAELGVPLAQGYRLARPAAGMQQLDAEAEVLLSALRSQREGDGVGALAEPCPTVAQGASRAAIAALLVRDPDCRIVALHDSHGRPAALLTREDFLYGHGPRPISLSVEPVSAIGEVAQRAVARPEPQRFEPIACCDERGALIGLVRVERLVEALAR